MNKSIAEAIGAARIVPVLRLADATSAANAARTMFDVGLPCVELTATTPGWPEALDAVRKSHPDKLLGMGTVTTADAARTAVERGANFLVSPYPAAEVRDIALAAGIPFIEGGFTPGELAA